MDESDIIAEAMRRWPVAHRPATNANQRQTNKIHSAFRQGFIEGAKWLQEESK
jgi:hypothetical protein